VSPIPTIRYPADLPITARRGDIVAALQEHQVVIVAGETGSGKTTQLPKMCLETGRGRTGMIGCTQPRRVAALSISRRVAEELGVAWGREVGCKMRFSDDTARDTRIKFMTDGILLAEIQSDPLLRSYSTLILDEAHERSLNIDFLLGHLQGLLRRRGDLKLLITSATIDTGTFSQAFGGAPVIEVSGRLWPVDVRHAPLEPFADEDGTGFVGAAVRAIEDAFIESDDGDVLVFMPTERDIRETRDQLEALLGAGVEVLGLYGRLPAAEQQRIFSPGPARRVVVATNIAETSLTLPRIRYVIDTGLARISRYNPRTRTKRLPVEEISQSSANQRAGRAGRVRDGVCIRLYAQDDFEKRPQFTQPEIQRANLAEVILRMKAFRLGEIETFPFLNPPPGAAIRAGYQLLHELGALDEAQRLTPLGHELARLPLDPTLGRMLLQAREDGALAEVLVIAAGLSIPDPRERPDEAREAAAAAHRTFVHPESDFLTLLNIWRAAPASGARESNNALRRFCKANYLSHARMREWRDIHRQLTDALAGDRGLQVPPNQPEAGFEAIHRCILSGQLGHVAMREDRNLYKASGNRQVTIFPGSGLYQRRDKPRKKAAENPAPEPSGRSGQPQWIVAGEIVQTSQLFARMVARIDPQWVVAIGAHLCKSSYSDPHWSSKAGRVLVWERILIHGLELQRKQIDFGKINPDEATELFIRGALVAGEGQIRHRFFEENRRLREKIETGLTRVRSQRIHDLDEAFYSFYAARIRDVSSVHDLNKLVRSRTGREPDFLVATEADLLDGDRHAYDRSLFPDTVPLANTALPVTYAYSPGEDRDGVTLCVPIPLAEHLSASQLHWMVPGLREEQMDVLLRALPKRLRRSLMPLGPKARELAEAFRPGKGDFLDEVASLITRKFQVPVKAADWPADSLPPHLRPRVEFIDRHHKTVATGRDLEALQSQVKTREVCSSAWDAAARRWEKPALTSWSIGDLPESVVIEEIAGAPVLGFPGLAVRDEEVDLRLFRTRPDAENSSTDGLRRLGELVLARDLAWLRKELRTLAQPGQPHAKKTESFREALDRIKPGVKTTLQTATAETLQQSAYTHIVNHVFLLDPVFPLTEARFTSLLDSARRDLPLLSRRVCDLTKQLLATQSQLLASPNRYQGFEQDLQRLLPADFLSYTRYSRLPHLLRYLRAVQIRAERAIQNPARDAERAKQILPFVACLPKLDSSKRERFRWLLEEFRVSVFAQELGTAEPVSPQRLKYFLEE